MRLILSFVMIAGSVGAARADTYDDTYDDVPAWDSYAWKEPRLASGIGVGIALGGGFGAYTSQHANDALASSQVAWSARMTIGTHIPLGLEMAYVGTWSHIDALAGSNATLLGTEAEAAARWNILPHFLWNPFLFVGVGWQHYKVSNADVSLADSGLTNNDHFAVMPVGGGLSYRGSNGIVLDLRGTYRLAGSSDLLVDANGNHANLDTWEANAALGYEF